MLLPLIVWKITTCDYVPTTSTFPTQVFFQHASFKSVSSNCEKRTWQAVWNHKLFRLLASCYSEMFTCWLITAHNKNTQRTVEKKSAPNLRQPRFHRSTKSNSTKLGDTGYILSFYFFSKTEKSGHRILTKDSSTGGEYFVEKKLMWHPAALPATQ